MAMDQNRKVTLGQRFRSLIQQWKRRGFIEIGPENTELFKLTENIRTGLRLQLLESEKLSDEPIEETFEAIEYNKMCSFQVLQPRSFQELRRQHNITEQDYFGSIAPSDPSLGYLQFVTTSKSGQLFVFCNDKRYIIKTEKKNDARLFMKILPNYLCHLKQHPHSLIVRYMGLYLIKQKGDKPIYFSVMKNVFYPDDRIIERYDLKGCQANRYVKPSQKLNQVGLVLKDQNFNKQNINIGPQKQWFDRQISIDTEFMQTVGVIDYSLLVGKQPLLESDRVLDERLADVVCRLKKSMKYKSTSQASKEYCNGINLNHDPENNLKNNGNSVYKSKKVNQDEGISVASGNGLVNFGMTSSAMEHTELSQDFQLPGAAEESAIPTKNKFEPQINHSLNDNEHLNIRLLPNLENSLHILDGVEDRYFLGIIDFFTTYGPKKKLEHAVKSIIHPFTSFSAVSVCRYADRFKDYLSSISV
ncbi:phosphatidylinositol 4-phosphate 5-kinase-like protein 1 [Anneissia japonica]|uniref:phosphatidylinositol 4-phosphate 5-kinase-like protein 1 n=1 Tax=Anneissia japonica TaxID=1529436 RepID=UPI001425598D|nr:phosphatidylinositol 4-phosphate 5-kinase-like protein 1 [Anneissia japonica]